MTTKPTYRIRRVITTQNFQKFGVFWGTINVEGGWFDTRSMAEDVADWWQDKHPDGPPNRGPLTA